MGGVVGWWGGDRNNYEKEGNYEIAGVGGL